MSSGEVVVFCKGRRLHWERLLKLFCYLLFLELSLL